MSTKGCVQKNSNLRDRCLIYNLNLHINQTLHDRWSFYNQNICKTPFTAHNLQYKGFSLVKQIRRCPYNTQERATLRILFLQICTHNSCFLNMVLFDNMLCNTTCILGYVDHLWELFKKRSRARVTIEGQCVLLQHSL